MKHFPLATETGDFAVQSSSSIQQCLEQKHQQQLSSTNGTRYNAASRITPRQWRPLFTVDYKIHAAVD